MAESAQPLDLITVGGTGIDLYPLCPDVPLTRTETFAVHQGNRRTGTTVGLLASG
ncbi:hypothetical protein [Streptomyces rishiriensis]|uniref:Uncharacterized protein n=1 Tax=Streptomyces rishiriensis TaxID=68264 RepID=A0ABU0NZW3_STRRH|nr:hypothetical protein [Streptomyces rishiriensis]